MEWILASALLVATVTVLRLRKKLRNSRFESAYLERIANQARAADNALLMSVLSREIANELIERDAEKYKKNFERLYDKWNEIKAKDVKSQRAHSETITSKYASFLDFDELGTKAHVLYADAFGWKSDEDLWELYESIRIYDALSCELDDDWRQSGTGIIEREVTHLREYCQKIRDTKLLAHLHKAREQLWLLESSKVLEEDADKGEWLYETKDYKFKRIPHFCESRWGIYVKSMDVYGMWGVFYDEVSYTSFYAANDKFDEQHLDSLNIRICVDARDYSRIEKMNY